VVADRKHRQTQVEDIVLPLDERSNTEQVEVVFPEFGSTVTVTEAGTDPFATAEPASHRATLVLVAGTRPGEIYTLDAVTVIGRDPLADITVEDSAVSRRHVRVQLQGDKLLVEDLGSANGTFVGGTRITRQVINNGDRIQLGPRVVLRFGLIDEAEERMLRQLFESSTRDPLTGAYNKKYITERLHAEVAHALRHHSPLEVVVIDLDRFKQVNDQHGHLVGDAVLRQVAERVQTVIRSEDVFGRFGGEEFVVLSRATNAARLAERIRAALENLPIKTERGVLRVTASQGVARLDELGSTATANSLIDKADQRLYAAKHGGRNRVVSTD
jgi:diguanylate cyclase (GGDEF)-like protein